MFKKVSSTSYILESAITVYMETIALVESITEKEVSHSETLTNTLVDSIISRRVSGMFVNYVKDNQIQMDYATITVDLGERTVKVTVGTITVDNDQITVNGVLYD